MEDRRGLLVFQSVYVVCDAIARGVEPDTVVFSTSLSSIKQDDAPEYLIFCPVTGDAGVSVGVLLRVIVEPE